MGLALGDSHDYPQIDYLCGTCDGRSQRDVVNTGGGCDSRLYPRWRRRFVGALHLDRLLRRRSVAVSPMSPRRRVLSGFRRPGQKLRPVSSVGQAGFNWQADSAVFGLEADFQGAYQTNSATIGPFTASDKNHLLRHRARPRRHRF
jgi:hypothetical protein